MRSRCRFLLGNQGRIPPPSTPAYLGVASFPPRPSHRVSRYYLSLRCVPCALQQRFSPAEPTSWDRQSDSGQRLCSIREISKERRSTSVLHARNGERRIYGPMSLHEDNHDVSWHPPLLHLSGLELIILLSLQFKFSNYANTWKFKFKRD